MPSTSTARLTGVGTVRPSRRRVLSSTVRARRRCSKFSMPPSHHVARATPGCRPEQVPDTVGIDNLCRRRSDAHAPSRRHRRQPHPVRPVERAVRARVQPGHADRDPGRPGRPVRAAGRAARRGRRRRGAQAQPRLQPDPRGRARLPARRRGRPAYDVQQACGTGLEAAILVANKIALGQLDVGIAGGVDTTSDAPIAVNEGLRQTLLELNRARSLPAAAQARRPASDRPSCVPEIPRNAEPRTGLSMGEHQAITAARVGNQPRGAGRARRGQPPQPRRRLRPRLLRRPGHRLPGPDPRPEPAAGHLRREAGEAGAGRSASGAGSPR